MPPEFFQDWQSTGALTLPLRSTVVEGMRRSAQRRLDRTLAPPARCARLEEIVEASLHVVPPALRDDVKLVFPSLHSPTALPLLAITTFHVARMHIIDINDATERERMRLYQRFARFAAAISRKVAARHDLAVCDWADIDGCAAHGERTMTIYDEVSGAKAMLGYRGTLCQCVPVVVHPTHGYANLAVHTMCLRADAADAKAALSEVLREWADGGDDALRDGEDRKDAASSGASAAP